MKILPNTFLDFNDVLLLPKRSELSSRSEVDLTRTLHFLHSKRTWTGVPILASNMDTTGTFEMYSTLSKHQLITVFHKHYTLQDYKTFLSTTTLNPNYYSLSTGISDTDWEKTKELINLLNPYFLTIDIANGYSHKLGEFCKKVRSFYPNLTIFAGNVVTRDMVLELLLNCGVDVVKVGLGSSSYCSTRLQTGVGVPQLSAALECAEAANGVNGHIISDGGCVVPGDVAKAFGAGSHFIMLGGMLIGHDESGGEVIIDEKTGEKYKLGYGMSSKYAQEKHNGGLASYRSSEGKIKKIPYRGPVNDTILDLLGGLRSTGTYIGAKRLKDFPKCATFIQVNRQVNTANDGYILRN